MPYKDVDATMTKSCVMKFFFFSFKNMLKQKYHFNKIPIDQPI